MTSNWVTSDCGPQYFFFRFLDQNLYCNDHHPHSEHDIPGEHDCGQVQETDDAGTLLVEGELLLDQVPRPLAPQPTPTKLVHYLSFLTKPSQKISFCKL